MTNPIQLENEEIKLLQDLLVNMPLQGTIQTLPIMLVKVTTILTKLDEALKSESPGTKID